MTMNEGFILSNKYRRAIFDELAAGETNIQRIAKKHRIIQTVAQRVVDDFIKNDIIEKGKELVKYYSLKARKVKNVEFNIIKK